MLHHLTSLGVQGCALAGRQRKLPASAIGAPVHLATPPGVPFFSNCMRNSPGANLCNNVLNTNNSKHYVDVINKYAASNDYSSDGVDNAALESRAFAVCDTPGPRLQVGENAVQQQASQWQGGQVGLSLVLCVDSMQF